MASSKPSGLVVAEKLREFDRVAALLNMPLAERLGILNISEEAYDTLHSGNSVAYQMVGPELERRLNYALPLMRKLASNSPVLRMPLARTWATA